MRIVITGQYATARLGKICAIHKGDGGSAQRGNGTVILDRPGEWMVIQNDGFGRKETSYVIVSESGEVAGLGKCMEIVRG